VALLGLPINRIAEAIRNNPLALEEGASARDKHNAFPARERIAIVRRINRKNAIPKHCKQDVHVVQIIIPEQKDDEAYGYHGCGEFTRTGQICCVEREKHRKEVNEQMVPVVLCLAYNNIAGVLMSLCYVTPPEQEQIWNYNKHGTRHTEVQVRNEANYLRNFARGIRFLTGSANSPQEKQRRDAR
jgi:hypothetical protein